MLWFWFLEFWLRSSVLLWYKKIYVHFEEELPDDGAIIFACTHPNSAVDYFFAPLTIRKSVHVLVRGDVFKNPILNLIFRAMWMLPVFRFRDGYKNLKGNDTSFKACYETFDAKGRVLIFSEGTSVQEKVVQPLQKGTARLALNYLEKHGGSKIYIVPLTNNYSRFRQFRGSVSTIFGKPIDVHDYVDLYRQNENKAFQALTEQIGVALHEQFIEVKNYSDDCLTEKALMALRLNRLDDRRTNFIRGKEMFEEEDKLVRIMNERGEDCLSDEWKELANKVNLRPENEGLLQSSLGSTALTFQHWMLTPIAPLTFIPSLIPHKLSQWFIDHKIKDIIFHNTIHIAGNLVFYFVQTLILSIISLILFGWIGMLIPATVYLITQVGGEIVDDYLFAKYNREAVKHKADFQKLYDEVAALMTIP